jgi:hypothetical protein
MIVALWFFPTGVADAIPISITATIDTYITEHSALGGPTSTHGSDATLYLIRGTGGYRAFPLVRFDLTPFAGDVVNGPTGEVRFELIGGHTFSPTQSVSMREVLVSWDANTASFANFGGTGFNEGVQTGPNLVTQTVTFSGVAESVPFTIPSAVIQNWIDSPSTNLGLILISNTTANAHDLFLSSREGSVRPTLSFDVTATPVPEASSLFLLGAGIFGLLGYAWRRRRQEQSNGHLA